MRVFRKNLVLKYKFLQKQIKDIKWNNFDIYLRLSCTQATTCRSGF